MPFLLVTPTATTRQSRPLEPLRTVHREWSGIAQPTEIPNVRTCIFRRFQPHEVGRGWLSETYIVKETKQDQVKQYGNAVTPPVMKMIFRTPVETLR